MDEKRQHPIYTDYFVTKDGEIFGPKKKRKPVLDNAGYARFTAYKDGKFKNRSWHRFVWEAFNGDILEGLEINHIDGDKLNNKLANLELVTPKQNTNHAVSLGLFPDRRGELNNSSKLTEDDVIKIRKMCEAGKKQVEIAKMFGVSKTVITSIKLRKNWKHVKDESDF